MLQQKILVVEHEENTIKLLEDMLSQYYQLFPISLGERAIKIIDQAEFSFAIISRCLPDIDGLEVLQKLRHKVPTLPIIFIAESPSNELIITAFRSGANDFIKKPICENDFLERIKKLEDQIQINFNIFAQPEKKVRHQPSLQASHQCSNKKLIKKIASKFIPHFKKGLKIKYNKSIIIERDNGIYCSQAENKSSVGITDQNVIESSPSKIQLVSNTFQLNFFGEFKVILNGTHLTEWPGKKAREMFAYLGYYHYRKVNRDYLIEKFWQRSTPDSARNCLNVTLHNIRGVFQQIDPLIEHILFRDECYFINPEIDIEVDVEIFKHHWRVAQSIEREKGIEQAVSQYELAATLYKGDFMEDALYSNWTDLERENLKEIYLVILNKLSQYYSSDGKPNIAINLCHLILEKDNCREDVHRRLMKSYFRIGQRDKALKQFNKCTEILKSELEVEPMTTTVGLYEQIKNGNFKEKNKN